MSSLAQLDSSECHILLLDDATYSGTNLVHRIDIESCDERLDLNRFIFHVVTGFYTREALDTLGQVFPRMTVCSTIRLDTVVELCERHGFDMPGCFQQYA